MRFYPKTCCTLLHLLFLIKKIAHEKLTIVLIASLFFFNACQKSETNQPAQNQPDPSPLNRNCASYEVLQAQLAADPSLALRMNAIETFTQRTLGRGRPVTGTTITVPVVVHVV